jgi:hypothetical protein|tara:strand:- start:1225 stop:1818 length:594 start_codon:yes stop_codon:yes gene_type:complete
MPLETLNSGGGAAFIRFSAELDQWSRSSQSGDLVDISWDSPVIVDIEKIQLGWLKLAGGRDWIIWPDNDVKLAATLKPSDEYRQGFNVKFYSSKLFDDEPIRELSANGVGIFSFIKAVYDACESGFGKDQVPALKITKSTPTRIGKGATKIPNFEIVKWVDRPAELSGNAPVTPPPVAQATPQAEPASADVFGNDEI